jgi:acetolactate synthase-1/3 small subunit
MMRHIISILIENESGALSRVAGLFSARGYNIESLTVAPTEDPSLSRMTLVTRGSEDIIAQITKQLNKLIDVVKLIDLADSPHIERELMMVKIRTTEQTRSDIRSVVDIFRGRILDVTPSSYVVEMTGASEKLDAFTAAISPDTIIEVVRSGATGISRGEHGLHL